jgi:hypothetical protein
MDCPLQLGDLAVGGRACSSSGRLCVRDTFSARPQEAEPDRDGILLCVGIKDAVRSVSEWSLEPIASAVLPQFGNRMKKAAMTRGNPPCRLPARCR